MDQNKLPYIWDGILGQGPGTILVLN